MKDLYKLKDEEFVLSDLSGKSEHASQLRAIFQEAGFDPIIHAESDFGVTLLGLVAKGLGISIMRDFLRASFKTRSQFHQNSSNF